jgi:transposase
MEPMVSDVLWRAFEPLIPKHPVSRKGGRPRANDRICLEGLVYMLRSGTPWHLFPKAEFGVGKSTVYDRFTEWTKVGVFNLAHHELLDQLGLAGKIDLSAAVIDSGSVRAVFGGSIPDQVPWIAAKMGRNATLCPMPTAHRC